MSSKTIEVLSVSVENKGKYNMAEVAYKDATGKVTSKKLMSFTYPDTYKALTDAKQGAVFTVEEVKNDKGYLDWVSVTSGGNASAAPAARSGNATPKSTYETAEERAIRQVLIVRQSSLSNAVEFLALNPKKVPTPQEVVEIAKFFESYVFGKQDTPDTDGPLEELENDIL